MRFDHTEDQRLLAESVRRLFERRFPTEVVRRFVGDAQRDPAWTREMAEAGLFGIGASPEVGGLGLGCVDALPVVMEAGRRLVPFPLTESIAASRLLGDWHGSLAAEVVAGTALVATAWDGTLERHADGRVSGALPAVPWAQEAGWLLAAAGDDLILVDLAAPGVTLAALGSVDLTSRMARVVLQGAPASHRVGAARAMRELGALLLAAEALGAAEAMFDQTVAYLKQRRQFGQVIGAFQSLKHIVADDAMRIESMRVALQYAAWAVDAGTEDAAIAVDVAKSYTGEAARAVAGNAIQLHGGIAYTWEFGLHLHMRRILRCGATGGGCTEHREAIAAALIDRRASHHPARAA